MGGDPRIEMYCDPRMMMRGDPRMGHSDPRIMFGCRPRRWMFRHMMMNSASSEDENTVSESEEHQDTSTKARREKIREERKEFRKMAREMGWFPRRCGFPQSDSDAEKSDDAGERDGVQRAAWEINREEVRERWKQMREEMHGKRQQFHKFVRETGVHPWMFKTLAQELYGCKKSEAAAERVEKPKDEEMADEEQQKMKEKFLQVLKELGAYPWMFRVLANQKARAAVTTGSESEGEVPLEGAAEDERRPDGCRRRERRQMFREMAKQMGWTSDSDGKVLTDGEKEEKEKRMEERPRIREMRREMAWMPWMKMMRGRHHHRHSPPHHGGSSRRHQHHHHDGDRHHHYQHHDGDRHGSHHLAD